VVVVMVMMMVMMVVDVAFALATRFSFWVIVANLGCSSLCGSGSCNSLITVHAGEESCAHTDVTVD